MNQIPTRMLAIDLRSTRMGFAVLETPIRLLDWGKRARVADSCSALILGLIRRYGIEVIVVRKLKVGSPRDTLRVRKGLRVIRSIAHSRSVPLATVNEKTFKNVFLRHGRHTRFAIAELMTTTFPQLARFLPNPRRCYDPESRRMSAFDAVALAVASLATQHDNDLVHELLANAARVLPAAPR